MHCAVPGADGWSEFLASDSEAAVMADRVPPLDLKEMQQFTEERLRSEGRSEAAKLDPRAGIRTGAFRDNVERTRRIEGHSPK